MKKYLSVFSVTARESVIKITFVWIISALLQVYLFYKLISGGKLAENNHLSELFFVSADDMTIPYLFSFTLLITGILLMKTGMEFRTKTGYTLRRLRISEKQVFLMQSVYNCLMIFILFLFEVALCFFLADWGTTFMEAKYVTNQTVYLTFYTADFLQELFAGRNIVTVIRNIFIIASLGFNLSVFSYLWRRGIKNLFGVLVLIACVALYWGAPGFTYAENLIITAVAVGTLLIALGIVHTRREEYDA
ncbi:MAG: hypothetical protein IJN70_03150 [Clostridia bacterium]|nr:hypothetical protein [Clostridia bacterium]